MPSVEQPLSLLTDDSRATLHAYALLLARDKSEKWRLPIAVRRVFARGFALAEIGRLPLRDIGFDVDAAVELLAAQIETYITECFNSP